jgi:hypothetical protein
MSLANITVSNVRGPDIPLYLAGARLQSFLPVSAILSGLGLNVTGFSYNGTLWVCAVCCRKAMPDPAFFAECLKDSFNELVAAAADAAPVSEESTAAAAPARRPTRTKAVAKAKASTSTPREPASAAAKPKRQRTVAKPASSSASAPAAPSAEPMSAASSRKPAAKRSAATARPRKAGSPTNGKDDAAA